MPGTRMVFDGLWRCLCPSVDSRVASRVLNAPLSRPLCSTISRQPTRPTRGIDALRRQCKEFSGAVAAASAVATASQTMRHALARDALIDSVLHAPPKDLDDKMLHQVSIDDLFTVLGEIQHRPNAFSRAAAITKHLIQARGVEPSPQLYECLIACARDTAASADMISQLLAEMKELKFSTKSMLFHDALEALAIHPNYILRNEILWAMRQSWTTLDPRGEAFVALGLLRDGQYELAFDKAEELLNSTADPPPWVFDIFVLVFARQGFLDEAVRLAHAKLPTTRGTTLSNALWCLLLDECARASHYPGAKFIWSRLTPSDHDRIPDGTLAHLMNTAARNGDPELAADATNTLSSRGARLGPHHYEAIIDSYAAAADIPSALRALCIMHRALSAVPEQSTRAIYTAILARPALLPPALDALSLLLKDHETPIQALNVLLEAAIATRSFSAAFEIYTSLPMYTNERPDAVTLTHLLKTCDNATALKLLVSENREAALKAHPEMFERAVYEFALAGDLEDAYKCVTLLGKSGRWVTRDTALTVVRRSLDAKDGRVWSFFEECKTRGLEVETGMSRMVAEMEEKASREEKTRREVTSGKRVVVGSQGDEGL